ncbi:MAG TPA: urease subunit gamma [Gaiellales bacterium]|jgi:urease subunit gamma/beta
MRLLPSEQERLNLFLAAELARRRRGRGLRLSQAEAAALIADETMELARDGLGYAEVERRAYGLLGPGDVLDGVAELVDRIELEPLFADGPRLVVLVDPIARDSPPDLTGDPEPAWLDADAALRVENLGQVAIGVTSHFHFFETNRELRFDRRAAWGMRLAVAPGTKVVFPPGEAREVQLVPFAGARVIRGHGGLVDGPLDDPGALDAALELARERGYAGA